ncbi:hypothetical protein QBC38DRAFT_17932 [Podospora fimiseda]|uniref:Uncharacterized protein n=1 Tax=Podospora fimiseda TaxID=252190 RepID=A0AAN7BJ63_9PEZI|nr:hypothetical protein QBC38DRAFT_17932 [Podospora fimiseda]
MALRYNAVDQVGADDNNNKLLATTTSPPASDSSSPSPMAYATLADKAFTPLSMNDSDFLSDSTSAIVEDDGLLRKVDGNTFLSIGQGIVRSNSVSSTGSSTPAGRGQPHTIVGTMVQSFETLHALRASAAAREQRDLLAKKSHGSLRAAALSPPATLSPSPSPAVQEEANPNTSSGETEAGLGAAANPESSATDNKTSIPAVPSNVADTPLIRPTPTSIPSPKQEEAILVRTASTASINLTHPTPDVNKQSQSGVFLGNIAALEASAERLSMTSSIEDAIREEHNELKRTESQRSSVLRRARAASGSDSGSVKQLSIASRKNSILEANNAARFGGYSPGGYIMSPQTSISAVSARLRSGSKTSSIGVPMTFGETLEAANGEDFPSFMSRHGPGKASVRSVASSKLSLAQIAELEYPTALTQDAFDKADRAVPGAEDDDEEARIVASAHQQIEPEFADQLDSALTTPHVELQQPMLDHGFLDEPAPRLQLHQPDLYEHYWHTNDDDAAQRPLTSTASVTTYDQAAFRDFDGVHCDPDSAGFIPHGESGFPHNQPPPQPRAMPLQGNNRPTSYFDPMSGQEMLFYPAPVPAMLNLPPKLSKKPKAAADAARNTRRSQVMSAMPLAARESRVWLPDPTEGLRGSRERLPLMTPSGMVGGGPGDRTSSIGLGPQMPPAHARHPSEASTIHPAIPPDELRRPERLRDADNRKSRATMLDGLPPQLRASAFFDLPAELPKIEVKGGSAMATLDSLLDASADAPVSAFTDHAFAGKLGSEVYGIEKKKKKKAKRVADEPVAVEEEIDTKPKRKTLIKNSNPNLLDNAGEAPKRSSHFSLFGGRKQNADDDSEDEDRNVNALPSPNPLAPGRDEQSSEEESEEESDEEQNVYHGPPTTLLAELQIRKQQNKLRTRPAANAFPNGMHSTLLELDAVAQVEQKARKGKRVNLAWEDPNANPDHLEDQNDEDVPLGMLAVSKALGNGNAANRSTMDISALMSEVHRPLGLMERREIEDNEPLSRRRDRLQGRDDGQLPLSLSVMQKRMSHMPLTPSSNGLMGMRSQSRLALPLPQAGSRAGSFVGADNEGEPEDEGETLAQRKARLAAENPLPCARPVSGMFSSELLGQFGADGETDSGSKGKGAHSRDTSADLGKDTNGVPEEEETLGQRRRRLQAEREAREREMGAAGPGPALTPLTLGGSGNLGIPESYMAPRPLSMANVLGAHPIDTPLGHMNPIEQERMRREAEAIRVQQQNEMKMAALRAQMPQTMITPSYGARTGGYMDGRFNNGLGGNTIAGGMRLGYNGSNISLLNPQQPQYNPLQQRPATMGYGAAAPAPMFGEVGAGYSGYGMQPNTPGQVDMVERWRQGVLH